MSNIRFACPKCGQHLACEPESQGTQIICPACKQDILIVTEKIRECYALLELEPGAPLVEVRHAHRERLKLWRRDRFPDDPVYQQRAAEKSHELHEALRLVTGYHAGKLLEPRSAPEPPPEETPPPPQEPAKRPRSAPEAPPPRKAPQSASGASAFPSPELMALLGSRLPWVGVGVVLTVVLGLIFGFGKGLLERSGPALSDESIGSEWVRASESAKRACCRTILIQLERKRIIQKYMTRVDDDFIYQGLESLLRQQKPEDLSSKLIDLCDRLLAERFKKKAAAALTPLSVWSVAECAIAARLKPGLVLGVAPPVALG